MSGPTIRVDLRTVLPVAALGLVVLVIMVIELCGREDVERLAQSPMGGPTATVGPTFTPGPSPTPGAEEVTATQEAMAGGDTRDATRVEDFAALQQALEQYRAEHGEYPSTEGNIQTLCAFTGVDVGCALEEVLTPLPRDPLGEPNVNGYFYASEGTDYVLYAQRESELFPPCDEHPAHLETFDSLLCARGP